MYVYVYIIFNIYVKYINIFIYYIYQIYKYVCVYVLYLDREGGREGGKLIHSKEFFHEMVGTMLSVTIVLLL